MKGPPGPPGPPPLPGMAEPPIPSMTIKRKIVTKFRLPNLNWIALKPQQVKGTVFCELDDEKLMNVIDFEHFEELFKTGNQNGLQKGLPEPFKLLPKPENVTLLDAQRQRNLGMFKSMMIVFFFFMLSFKLDTKM